VVGFGALFMLARFSEAFLVLRGSGHSFFNLVSELALLVASVLAGLLWDRLGAATTFLAGAGLSLLAMVAVLASPVGARRAGG
jgi:predicted MFS family arabinose efflux permease